MLRRRNNDNSISKICRYAITSQYYEWNELDKHHFDIKFLSFDLEIQVASFWRRLQHMHDKLPILTVQKDCWGLSESLEATS